MKRSIDIGPVRMRIARGWRDITATVEAPEPPLTLAHPDGVGALQLSMAAYCAGPLPDPSLAALRSMLDALAAAKQLGRAVRGSRSMGNGPPKFATASYHAGDDLVRAWYLAHRGSFALATYVCDWRARAEERADIDAMIATIRFS